MTSSRSIASASKARVIAALAACALILGASAPAAEAAKKKVVVLDFKGPKAAPMQKTVVTLLKKSATVLDQKKFSKAAKKVKGFKANASGVSKVARKLKAYAVVSGKVSKKKGKYKLTIQVREGKSGDYVGDDINITMKAGKLTKANEKKIARELKSAIADLPDPNGSDEDEEEEVAEEDGGGGEEADEPKGKGKGKGGDEEEDEVRVAGAEDDEAKGGDEEDEAKGGDEEEDVGKGGEEEEEDDGGGKPKGKGGDDGGSVEKSVTLTSAQQADLDARGRAVDVSAGLSFQQRALTFAHDAATNPQGYDGAMVPGLYILGEVYPMALVNKKSTGFARNIGLSLVVDKVLLIKSKPAGMEDVNLPTAQTRYGVGLVYRLNFGSSPSSPTLKLGARYNKLSFTIDESGAPAGVTVDIPDVSYTYIDPGVAFRYPLTPKIAANAEAHYLVVTSAGQIQEMGQYGPATASGFDFDLGGEYKLSSSLLVRAGFRVQRIALTFDGTGTLAMSNAVQSATDRYLGVYFTAGYLF